MHCPALYLFVRKGRDGGYTAGGPSGEESDLRGTPTLGRGEGHGGRGKDIVGVSNNSAIFILAPCLSLQGIVLYPLFATLLFLS